MLRSQCFNSLSWSIGLYEKEEVFDFDPNGLEPDEEEEPKGFAFDRKGVDPVVDFENGFEDLEKGFVWVFPLIAELVFLEKGFEFEEPPLLKGLFEL